MTRLLLAGTVSFMLGVIALSFVHAQGTATQKTAEKTQAISQRCEPGSIYEISGSHDLQGKLKGRLKTDIQKKGSDEKLKAAGKCLARYTLPSGEKKEELFDNSGKEDKLKALEKEYVGRYIAGEVRYDRYTKNDYLARTYGSEFNLQAMEALPQEAGRLERQANDMMNKLDATAADAAAQEGQASAMRVDAELLRFKAGEMATLAPSVQDTSVKEQPVYENPAVASTFPEEKTTDRAWKGDDSHLFGIPEYSPDDSGKAEPEKLPPTIWDNIRCDIQNNCPEEQPFEYGPTLADRAVNAVERITCSWGYCSDEEADAADRALKDKESYATWPRVVDTNQAEIFSAQEASRKAAAEYAAEEARWEQLYADQNQKAFDDWKREEAEREFAARLTEETLYREQQEEIARETAEAGLAKQLYDEDKAFRDDVEAKMKTAREIAALNYLMETEYQFAKEAEEAAKEAQAAKERQELDSASLGISRGYCGFMTDNDDDYYGCLKDLSTPVPLQPAQSSALTPPLPPPQAPYQPSGVASALSKDLAVQQRIDNWFVSPARTVWGWFF